MLIKALRFIVGLALLFLMLYLGKLLSLLIPIGIPESIWGMLILFTSMVIGLIKVTWVLPASTPLTRYMTLFFLPICAGVVDQFDMLNQHVDSLIFANFFSTMLSLILLGYLAQKLFTHKAENGEEDE
ncbi:CidA/LrgA family protein [Otariodibacter oris]|uniref:Holin-like protein n=1 Tax=Otariodibacter oris TaxID=1032623 RepID=A0A420XFZ9_9PAST|nr:CidA/LrgA family protein [Otariodibacter oris]QGM80360.1 murein hydrolase transporter LrgA [Otariodibacter oris]RKR71730.1 holin-like protein [Otariodibacter oris]